MDLVEALDDLGEEEFQRFRWCLMQIEVPDGFRSIKRGRLEKASRCDTVDLMMQAYKYEGAIEVTCRVLKHMSRNDLVQRLAVTTGNTSDIGETLKNSGTWAPSTHPLPASPPSNSLPAVSTPMSPLLASLSPTSPPVVSFPPTSPSVASHPPSSSPPVKTPPSSLPSSSPPPASPPQASPPPTSPPPTSPPTTSPPPASSPSAGPSRHFPNDSSQIEGVMVPVPEPQPIKYYQKILQSNFQDKFMCAQEGWAENKQCMVDIYTELYMTVGGNVHINTQHEVRQIEKTGRPVGTEKPIKPCEMFEHPSGEYRPIRTVLTNGIAGIGKTFFVRKFVLDWAERRTNQDVDLIFPFTFRQLNSLTGERFCLAELIHECIPETVDIKKEALNHIFTTLQSSGNTNYDKSKFKLLFVFDGLDESRLHLDLNADDIRSVDITRSTKADILLRKLINGKLLQSARIWITTRPAAANQIPQEFVDRMTEVRGFTDLQKEQYFRKRFTDEEHSNRIISHMKTSRSLHIMCHIPVFCWITATVLEDVLTRDGGELPKTLTEMYTEFLVFQIDRTKEKYGPEKCVQYIESLAKLAFHQLEKGKLIFYEEDLKESGIDFRSASVCSGVFTEIFKEERGRKEKDKMFSFVHLSIQEFLAAVYVEKSLINSNKNVMPVQLSLRNLHLLLMRTSTTKIHRIAIDRALRNPNGHLDLFLRFLLGLSLPSNQNKLQGLLRKTNSSSKTNQKTIEYIKKKISKNLPPERSINLFHCLNELNDHSLVEEIQQSLGSGRLSTENLSPAQWSALVFILLSSVKDLDVFDLKKYSASEEAFLRLLPVVRASNKALLSSCNLSERSYEVLSSVLGSQSSSLRDLDLSNNNVQDSGVKLLSAGLKRKHCQLQNLRLSQCNLTGRSCEVMSSVISSQFSSLRDLDLSNNSLQDSGVKALSTGLGGPHCQLKMLRMSSCNLSQQSGEALSSVLSSQSSSLTHLDLSNNDLKDSGVKQLSVGLKSPNQTLETLSLSSCLITQEGCRFLVLALRSNPSHLRELDLSYNHLGDSGVKCLSAGLEDPHWRLDTLGLRCCYLSVEHCEVLSAVLSSKSSSLRVLDLRNNDLQDSGVKALSAGLENSHCVLEAIRLSGCNLFRKSCKTLSTVLGCQSSSLRDLDLSDNDLQDSGMKLLSAGLKNPQCHLEKLGLSGCMITEDGCASLASALNSNPSHLRELDLSYNHPGDSGVKLLSAGLEGPHWKLDNLSLGHGREQRLKSGLKKYACVLEMDTNTTHTLLKLSNNNRTVTWVDQQQPYADHLDRFDYWEQLLCRDSLSGRCYWEVEWSGEVDIAVAYRGIGRKGKSANFKFGGTNQSWSLYCAQDQYAIWHNNRKTVLHTSGISHRVAVYVDCLNGSLSFYKVSDTLIHLHTFNTIFTEPLYPGFGLWSNSSVTLCGV